MKLGFKLAEIDLKGFRFLGPRRFILRVRRLDGFVELRVQGLELAGA